MKKYTKEGERGERERRQRQGTARKGGEKEAGNGRRAQVKKPPLKWDKKNIVTLYGIGKKR